MAIVKTDDGVDIYVLPAGATCVLCGKNPLYMTLLPDGCPEKKWDWDMTCKPSYCPYYTEGCLSGDLRR